MLVWREIVECHVRAGVIVEVLVGGEGRCGVVDGESAYAGRKPSSAGAPVRLVPRQKDPTLVRSPDARETRRIPNGLLSEPQGIMLARVGQNVPIHSCS